MDKQDREGKTISKGDIIDVFQEEIESLREENRHIESQAGLFLRIWLAFLGLFLTAAVAGGSSWVDHFSSILKTYNPRIPEQTDTILLLDGFGSYFASRLILTIGTLALFSSVALLFILPPYSALKSIRNEDFQYSLTRKKRFESDFSDTDVKSIDSISKQEIIDRYEKVVFKASKRVERTRDSWDSCLNSLFWGLKLFTIGVLSLTILFVYNIVSVFIGILCISICFTWGYQKYGEQIQGYFTTPYTLDITYALSCSVVIAGLLLDEVFRAGGWITFFVVLLPIVILAVSRDFSLGTNVQYLYCSSSYFGISFLLLFAFDEYIYEFRPGRDFCILEFSEIILFAMLLTSAYLMLLMVAIVFLIQLRRLSGILRTKVQNMSLNMRDLWS